jgi:hypothetical protein
VDENAVAEPQKTDPQITQITQMMMVTLNAELSTLNLEPGTIISSKSAYGFAYPLLEVLF